LPGHADRGSGRRRAQRALRSFDELSLPVGVIGMRISGFRSLQRRPGVVAAALAICALSGCTYGSVSDGKTGQGIGHAKIVFEKLRMDTDVVLGAKTDPAPAKYVPTYLTNADVRAWDAVETGSQGNAGLFYLNYYGVKNAGDTKKTLVDPGWNRITVTAPGYETSIFLRDHQYTPNNTISKNNPYSSGAYAWNPTEDGNGAMAGYSLDLYPVGGTHERKPDLVVDPRLLSDIAIVNDFGGPPNGYEAKGCEAKTAKCLRYTTGVLNIGNGDLWVVAPAATPHTPVVQRVYNAPTGTTSFVEHTMPTDVQIKQDTHPHLHFPSFTHARLRAYESGCSTALTASQCPILRQSPKVSFCIEDYRSELSPPYQLAKVEPHLERRQAFVTCEGQIAGPSGTTLVQQGLGSGYMDTYRKALVGQLIDIAGLPAGKYWLEVEVNPDRYIVERDYENNVTRIVITIQ
jgi:hypothetical protein